VLKTKRIKGGLMNVIENAIGYIGLIEAVYQSHGKD